MHLDPTRVEGIFNPDLKTPCLIPLFTTSVEAGFPSPAEDYIEGQLDLNEHLIRHPAATFFVRVSGDSMIGAGIHPGDILIVDRSLKPENNRVVIAVVDGELTVKRMRFIDDGILLVPENSAHKPIRICGEMQFEVWGVVTSVIHSL